MAWTQSDIDTLKQHLASGVLSVQFRDRSVTYKSNEDMLQSLALMEREVLGTTAAPGFRVAAVSKGV